MDDIQSDDQPLLKVEHLCVVFRQQASGTAFRVLDDIDLSIAKGETVGLVGESGSGKTTLGRAILRMFPVQQGKIYFEGVDISRHDERKLRPLRRNMQMIFQDPASSFNPRQSIGSALRVAICLHGRIASEDINARVNTLLERVSLPLSFRSRLPHELSGGQLQRVAIARALALEPKLVIADEAVSKLDVSVRSGVLNLLRDLQEQEGLSLLFITHDLDVARYLSHTVVVLYHGKVLEQGSAMAIFQNPLHPYTRLLTGRDDPLPTTDTGSEDLSGMGCRYAAQCPYVMAQCRSQMPRLEPVDVNHAVACWRTMKLHTT